MQSEETKIKLQPFNKCINIRGLKKLTSLGKAHYLWMALNYVNAFNYGNPLSFSIQYNLSP